MKMVDEFKIIDFAPNNKRIIINYVYSVMGIYAFGDSFIGPLMLIKDNNLKIRRFSGATMRGLLKQNNPNRQFILNTFEKKNDIDCAIFSFGQVDLLFSYYYKKYVKQEKFMMKLYIKQYVEFVNSLSCDKCTKVIIGLYPLTIKDEYVFDVLLKYGILTQDQIDKIDNKEKKRVSKYKFRNDLHNKFNKYLKHYCQEYNVRYLDFEDKLLNEDNVLDRKFLDPHSNTNVHLLWEPLIYIILSKMPCHIKKLFKLDLKKSYEEYIKWKKMKS